MKYSPRQMGGVKRARTQPKKGDKGRISKRKRSASNNTNNNNSSSGEPQIYIAF